MAIVQIKIMKPPLTFLLTLSFLFFFSGSVYGDENDVFTCKVRDSLYAVNLKKKTITVYSVQGSKKYTYSIIEHNEVSVRGRAILQETGEEKKELRLVLHKHSYRDERRIKLYENSRSHWCSVGDKKF